MILLRRYWLAFLFIACAFCIAAVSYAWLPARVAVHWTPSGEPDRWMPKQMGAFILPLIGLVSTAVLIAIEPRAARGAQPNSTLRAYATVVSALSALLLYATISVVGVAMGLELNVGSDAAIGLGVVLMVLGNSLGKTTRNSTIGVRLPWTMASDEVWSRANRLTGWLLVLGGLVTIIGALITNGIIVALCVIAATTVVSTVYSYAIARRLRNK